MKKIVTIILMAIVAIIAVSILAINGKDIFNVTIEGMDYIVYVTAIIAGTIVLFVITRELITWYFKVNQRVDLLENILEELKELNR